MRKLIPLAALSAAFALSACVSIGPKLKPVQMYRFAYTPDLLDAPIAAPPAAATGMPPAGIVMGTVTFPQDSSGDRITTIEGNEVSYVAQSRWTAPAQELFNEAVSDGFARSAQTVRLEARGPSSAGYRLDITVRQFESVYTRNRPTVSVALDARIIRLDDKVIVGQRFINADVPVNRNDMSMTADAYSKATTEAVAGLIGFAQDTMVSQEGVQTPSVETPSDGKQHVEGL